MTTPRQDPADRTLRPNFSFSVEGVAPRDELLFKSFLRLLDHRTAHGWFYSPERSAEQLDLRVVSDRVAASIPPLPASCFQAVLTLSAVERKQPGFLTLPIHADELEAELNRLGTLIENTRRAMACNAAGPAVHAHRAELPSVLGDRPFKLTRWPSTDLLGSPARLRIATMLVGRPMTLAELSQKTNQPLPQCIEIVNDLWRANLLTGGNSSPLNGPGATLTPSHRGDKSSLASKKSSTASRGLLSRIRSRLGL